MFHHAQQRFESTLRCYSITTLPNKENYGGKIVLPPSALARLSLLQIDYPMLFVLKSQKGAQTHAGVLEFIAEEGRVYIPDWMQRQLEITNGDVLNLQSCSLKKGTFVKIQPQHPNFLDISDPKAVLEQAFRQFSTLTLGDIIQFQYNAVLYDILVMETKPDGGISIFETDLEVDFAPPLGYVEPTYQRQPKEPTSIDEHVVESRSSIGSGQKLNGKEVKEAYSN